MEDEMDKPVVKCADCGLLSLRRSDTGNRVLVEVDERTRGDGAQPEGGFDSAPTCIVREWDLPKEHARTIAENQPKTKRFSLVTHALRVCPKFLSWSQGFSPQEHVSMMQLEIQAKANEERRKADEDFREERRKNDLERDDRLRKEAGEREKDNRKIDLGPAIHQLSELLGTTR